MSIIFDKDFYADKTITREFSLKNTHIGYNNLTKTATITASSSAAGFPPSALNNPFTYDFWRSGTLPVTIDIDTGAQNEVDYIGIAKHNLRGVEIVVSSSTDNITFTERTRFVVCCNYAAMIVFQSVTARYFRIQTVDGEWTECAAPIAECGHPLAACGISAASSGYAQIGVLSLGKSLEMQRMIFGGHAPARLFDNAELRPSISEGGAWLGRSVIRTGATCEYSFNNLTGSWYREKFVPFSRHAITEPFFIAWRPLGYANECQYAWTNNPIQPKNTGPNDWLSVSFNVTGCE